MTELARKFLTKLRTRRWYDSDTVVFEEIFFANFIRHFHRLAYWAQDKKIIKLFYYYGNGRYRKIA